MNANPHRSRRAVAAVSEPLETRVLFVRVEGIDVSQFQGVINWSQIATNNKQFVFMRASRTNLDKDPTFDANLAGATAAGLLVGTYHYTLPNNLNDAGPPVDPVLDAQRYFAAAGHTMTTGFLPPVIDAEAAGPVLGKTAYSQWINAFSDEIFRLSGVRPIVYANINYAVNFLDESVAAKHKLWLARYNNGNDPSGVDPQTSQPEIASFHPMNPYGAWNVPVGGPRSDDSWRFWQYTSTGDGIATGVSSVNLDLDLYNGSIDELRKEFLIGFQKNFGTADNNPFAVAPGTTTVIQAEDYDIGGDTISYADATPTVNSGGVFRTSLREGVDLAPVAAGGFAVADTAPGEFVEYTVDVATAGDYQLAFHVAQTEADGAFHAEVDGVALPALVAPDTDSFDTFVATTQSTALTAGRHVIRVAFDTAAANGQVANLDRIEISDAPAPTPTPNPTPTPTAGAAAGATYVRGGTFARQNFGPATELLVQRGRGSSNTMYTVLHFDLTDVTSVASAKLRLTGRLSDAALPSMQTNVYSVSKLKTPFNEHQATFKNKPAGKKLRGAITVAGTADAAYELDLTSFVQAELAAGRKTVTLVLRNVTRSVTTQTVFGSNETANPPSLVLA